VYFQLGPAAGRPRTNLSESSPRDELIEMLNRYFGPMCDAVEASGGEVLKFIGDSVIFPIEQDATTALSPRA
jgi:adenylate cyclase